jgi:hypothetical protein
MQNISPLVEQIERKQRNSFRVGHKKKYYKQRYNKWPHFFDEILQLYTYYGTYLDTPTAKAMGFLGD